MNTQEIFNTCYTHLLTQNEQAVFESESEKQCKYRLGALKCAVGILISDRHYSEELEGLPLQCHDVSLAVSLSIGRGLKFGEIDLLTELQETHDELHPAQWKSRLDEIAKSWKLKIPSMEIPV